MNLFLGLRTLEVKTELLYSNSHSIEFSVVCKKRFWLKTALSESLNFH